MSLLKIYSVIYLVIIVVLCSDLPAYPFLIMMCVCMCIYLLIGVCYAYNYFKYILSHVQYPVHAPLDFLKVLEVDITQGN